MGVKSKVCDNKEFRFSRKLILIVLGYRFKLIV